MNQIKPAVHFVGFRGEEYWSAVKVFGPPDFTHHYRDRRLYTDVAPGDTVIFANGEEDRMLPYSFNDSEYVIYHGVTR